MDPMPSDSRVSSFGVGGVAGEALEVSEFDIEGEDEDEEEDGEDSAVTGARTVGSGFRAHAREVVESDRYAMRVLFIVCLFDCNNWDNGKSLMPERIAALPIRLNSMILYES